MELISHMIDSYRTYFRLFRSTFSGTRNTQARLTPRRFIVMSVFLPFFFVLMTVHWLGFITDEVIFRGYRKIPVFSPVFIVGVPRSGTTFLHRVLANDEQRFTKMSLWELILAPSVTERKIILGMGSIDGWLGSPIRRFIGFVERIAFGRLDAIHRISLSDPEEDYFALAPVFACYLLILPFPFSDELGDLAQFDHALSPEKKKRIMAFYKSCLQRHLYVHGNDKLLLSKNVSFAPAVESLNETFPDCKIIATVRNPLDAIPSHISSMMEGAELFDNHTQGTAFRDQMIEVQRFAYSHLDRVLPEWPMNRQVILRFEDLKSLPVDSIKTIYSRFGMELSQKFASFLDETDRNQKAYRSRHHYSAGDYNLEEGEIYAMFRDVFESYGYDAPPATPDDQPGVTDPTAHIQKQ